MSRELNIKYDGKNKRDNCSSFHEYLNVVVRRCWEGGGGFPSGVRIKGWLRCGQHIEPVPRYGLLFQSTIL